MKAGTGSWGGKKKGRYGSLGGGGLRSKMWALCGQGPVNNVLLLNKLHGADVLIFVSINTQLT